MEKKDLSTYKRKYQAFRHHAWAGLGFLSVALAVRIIYPESAHVLTPIIFALIIYIVAALILTYKYRTGLSSEEKNIQVEPSAEIEKERLKAEVEKQRLKTEKKKAKAEAKKAKKK
jgi:membrane glycosyltransferase